MDTLFSNISIGRRILFGLLVPMAGMVGYAGILSYEKFATSQEMARVADLAGLAPQLSAVAHELQKERGQSAGFLGSSGKSFAETLPGQRDAADEQREALHRALETFDFSSFDGSLKASVGTALKRLEALESKRADISRLELSVPEMAKYYTGTIMSLLQVVEEALRLSSDDRVSKQISAYINYLQAKERAGLERAMGAAGFGSGAFKPEIYNRFVQFLAAQDLFVLGFRLYATEAASEFEKSTMTGEAIAEVERMRAVALGASSSGVLDGVDAAYWFATITAKIDLMKSVEDFVAQELNAIAGRLDANARTEAWVYGGLTLVLVLASVMLLTVVARSITRPVAALTEVMAELAAGNKEVDIPGVGRGDEIGSMSQAVEVFKRNALDVERLEAEQAEAASRAEREKKEEMARVADRFEQSVMGIVDGLTSSSEQLEGASQQLSSTAEVTSERCSTVAAASQEASANTQTVASAAEELDASVREIARQVSDSSTISNAAVSEAGQVVTQMRELDEASQRIGEVVSLINDVAAQTNLLALNATIEAARAGEAGKGFAVVASEVKNLASQTETATNEISGQISSVQTATGKMVGAIESISQTINRVNEITAAISAAVEQQGSATSEISLNVQQAAEGSRQVDINITDVSEGTETTGASAGQVATAAQELSALSRDLRTEVDNFLSEIKSA